VNLFTYTLEVVGPQEFEANIKTSNLVEEDEEEEFSGEGDGLL
jgi:hypothetical protein